MGHKIFTYTFTIQEIDLDIFGHMNNSAYLKRFEEARWDLMFKNGYSVEKIQSSGLGPTILEAHVSFLKELHLNDVITIETTLLFYKNKIAKLSQKMLRDHDICCTSEFTIGLFDLTLRKLVLPTKEWLNVIGFIDTPKEK